MTLLHPCPSCARHVKKSEAACPFCSTPLALANVPARARPTQRMGRAATFAFGVATSVAACSSPAPPTGNDASTAPDTGVSPLYGGPPEDAATPADAAAPVDGGSDAGSIPDEDAGGPGPLYGGPFPEIDAGNAEDAGGAAPAYGAPSPLDAGGAVPAYGTPAD